MWLITRKKVTKMILHEMNALSATMKAVKESDSEQSRRDNYMYCSGGIMLGMKLLKELNGGIPHEESSC